MSIEILKNHKFFIFFRHKGKQIQHNNSIIAGRGVFKTEKIALSELLTNVSVDLIGIIISKTEVKNPFNKAENSRETRNFFVLIDASLHIDFI